MIWLVCCGLLALLIQAGFALIGTGLCRAKNAAHTMATSFLVFAMSVTGFFAFGFALMGAGGSSTEGWRVLGTQGFFLHHLANSPQALGKFVYLLAFISIAATIPAGALAERWSLKSFVLYSFLVGGIIAPVYGCWAWGGGWLAQLGARVGLGHGVVDYAGSAVMHLQGGTLALITALMLGPRIGKYDAEGHPRAILGHHLPMVFLGTMILAVGWFGLNIASSLASDDGQASVVATNTILSAVAGTLSSALYMHLRFGKPDPSMMCNGMLAGLVASAAGCAYLEPWAAFFTGIVAGVLVVASVFFWERRGVDDPVGAISIHATGGLWGMIALGLFADASAGVGLNGVPGAVAGLFYGGGKQFVAQLLGVLVAIAWNLLIGGLLFWVTDKLVTNRVSTAVEIAGLDIPEMGAPGYPEFIEHMTPEMISRSDIVAAELGEFVHQ